MNAVCMWNETLLVVAYCMAERASLARHAHEADSLNHPKLQNLAPCLKRCRLAYEIRAFLKVISGYITLRWKKWSAATRGLGL